VVAWAAYTHVAAETPQIAASAMCRISFGVGLIEQDRDEIAPIKDY
jgi:hypothetical protein